MKRRNKMLVSAVILSMTAGVACGLTGCKDGESGLTFMQAYETSAIGGISLLNANFAQTSTASYAQGGLTESQKSDILGNLAMAQNLIAGGVVKSEESASDKVEYAHYYTVTASDYTGAQKTYKFYYNKTDVTGREDAMEGEQEFALNGLVVLGDVEYQMLGEQEVERGETEFTFTVKLDEQNWVQIEQESEAGEVGFQYTAYQRGQEVFSTEVEYEVNRNGAVELEFEMTEGAVEQEYKYVFYEEGGQKYARVQIGDDASTLRAKIKMTQNPDGTTKYEFVN